MNSNECFIVVSMETLQNKIISLMWKKNRKMGKGYEPVVGKRRKTKG